MANGTVVDATVFGSDSAKSNRESLHDTVTRITPTDHPIYMMADKESVKRKKVEWAVDENRASRDNANPEGSDYVYENVTATARLQNYTQIFRAGFQVSETQEATATAGNVEHIARQQVKKGMEIMTDIERSIVSNTASVAATGTTAGRSGGLPTWLETNDSLSTGTTAGVDGGYDSSTGLTTVATNGTQRAFTRAQMDAVMQSCYENGGKPSLLVVSPYLKGQFAGLINADNTGQWRTYANDNARGGTIMADAAYYQSPWGRLMVMPSREMTRRTENSTTVDFARNAFILDKSKLCWSWLRRIQTKIPGRDSDVVKRMIVGEGCLRVKNEKASGIIADLFGSSATT